MADAGGGTAAEETSGGSSTGLIIGLVIAAIGAVMMLGVPLGRLPGDIAVRKEHFSFYFPLTTSIVLSIVLTLLLAWFRR